VEKELGGKGKVSPAEFRQRCRDYATRYVEQHKRDFKRLGVFGRWNDPYLTMSHSYEATIAGAFLDFMEKGYVYRGRKPVYWCIHDNTALAEAEVEYEDHTSPSIWVRYPVIQNPPAFPDVKGGFYAIVWTTTPWTLPASMALAFNRNLTYALAADDKGDMYIVAADLINAVAQATGLRFTGGTVQDFPGAVFANMKFRHPFLDDRELPVVLAQHVTLDQGSGIVHTAPGHGAEDFAVGQEYGLDTYAPIDDRGVFTEGLPEYLGKNVFQANPAIIELLRKRERLLAEEKIRHSYPHCWRCHNPVIFRATEQWFIHMDNGTASVPPPKAPPLRKAALREIHNVKWIPGWGEDRIYEMIENRPDWCVSRQRFWGVPIIVFFCDACGRQLSDFAALRNVVKWFEKEGADAWYTHSHEELLPPGTKCSCGASKWRKESDILDVWFDSGSSHLAVLHGKEWPADVYLEGPDQYRGWFHSSLLIAVGIRDKAPYRCVVTHGWTLDEQGRPMSKSLGNVVLPTQICDKWGADLLRLWVASQEYQADVKMSERVMTQLSEAYRKIRNTFRFALGNLSDFDPSRDALANEQLDEMDRWMLERTADLVKRCREWYAAYEFHRVYHAIHDYCVVDLSAFYYDVLKDRLYTKSPNSRSRRSAQTAVWKITSALVRLAAPILVFTAEELWKYFPKAAGESESVHIALFPQETDLRSGIPADKASAWELLGKVRGEVLKALETARNEKKLINSGLEAKVLLNADLELKAKLKHYLPVLPTLFIVSQVDFINAGTGEFRSEAVPGLEVTVQRADGKKCERCWNFSTHVGENTRYPTICERCSEAIAEIEAG
jgi:isoleucyl-tRNA synthetase